MYPRLLTTPFLTVHTFGVLLAAAYLAALGWTVRGARRAGLDPDAIMSLGIWAIVGALVGVPLHPAQLYESAVCLGLFGLLVWLGRRRHRDGDIIAAYTLLYALARFGLEYLRGDADRGFVFGGLLSTSQFIAIIMFMRTVVVMIARQRDSREAASP